MNLLTKAIGYISPERALRRVAAAKTLEILNSGYSGGGASGSKKAFKGWTASSQSPEMDINANLMTLRSRSRDLYMNAPLARSALNTMRTNVVGGGLKLKSRIDFEYLGMTSEEADRWEKAAEREFNFWAENCLCDSLRLNNFYEIQQIAQISWLASGDVFVVLKQEKPSHFMPYGLRLHLLEADRICNPDFVIGAPLFDYTELKNGNDCISGVEINDRGAVVAYHVANRYPYFFYPSSQALKWTRVEAFGKLTGRPNILHLMESERPEQRRGVPILAPVIESLKQLDRYKNSELTAAQIASMIALFIKTASPLGASGFDIGSNVSQMNQREVINQAEQERQWEAGAIYKLEEGEEIGSPTPQRSVNNFDSFVIAYTRDIGAALEIPHEVLLKHFTSSYSASRGALLEAWKMFRMRRSWLSHKLCQPVYDWWLTEAVATGRIQAPGFFEDPVRKKAWCGADWIGEAQGSLNPMQETNASIAKINNGLSTRERETLEHNGGDFDKNAEQLKREAEKMRGFDMNGDGR